MHTPSPLACCGVRVRVTLTLDLNPNPHPNPHLNPDHPCNPLPAISSVLRRSANAGSCEFGAEQAILVASETTKRELQARVGSRALVLTVLESKGLEFQVMDSSSWNCMRPFRDVCTSAPEPFTNVPG